MTSEAEIEQAVERIVEVISDLSPTASTERVAAESDRKIRLTSYTHGLGCACKLRPLALEKILKRLPSSDDKNVLVGTETSDDAAVYKVSDNLAIVETVDFFTPIVDDPYHFGAIAAANSLSDIYAMGGKPIFALSVVGFPSNRLPMEVLERILRGANDKTKEAGISIIGGHTVDDTEPKYGLAVTGLIDPKRVITNNTARVGDLLILTKPIGVGIISTAIKRQLADQSLIDRVIEVMSTLNNLAADAMLKCDVSACTDITGFGLLGHLKEMTDGSGVDARLQSSAVPVIEEATGFASAGVIPGGTENNLEHVSPYVTWGSNISRTMKYLLADAQTSGGLLIAVHPKDAQKLLAELKKSGVEECAIIGEIVRKGKGVIEVV